MTTGGRSHRNKTNDHSCVTYLYSCDAWYVNGVDMSQHHYRFASKIPHCLHWCPMPVVIRTPYTNIHTMIYIVAIPQFHFLLSSTVDSARSTFSQFHTHINVVAIAMSKRSSDTDTSSDTSCKRYKSTQVNAPVLATQNVIPFYFDYNDFDRRLTYLYFNKRNLQLHLNLIDTLVCNGSL